MIHRPSRLPDIFVFLAKHGLEPKRMRLVFPFKDKDANLVLIEARKNARPELKVEAPLVVREKDCSYTNEINLIYKYEV